MIRSRLVGKELVCVCVLVLPGCDNLLHYLTQAGVFVCGLFRWSTDLLRLASRYR